MKFSSSIRAAAVATAAAVALAACGGGDTASESAVSESVPATAAPATEAGTAAPADPNAAFVPLADGGQLDFNSLRGQDVLLWFWAPW